MRRFQNSLSMRTDAGNLTHFALLNLQRCRVKYDTKTKVALKMMSNEYDLCV